MATNDLPDIPRPENESIFPNTFLTPKAVEYKRLVAKGKHAEAIEVLNVLIIHSTPMFERLAQHENFHTVVPLDRLVSAAQNKMVKWILAWDPHHVKSKSLFSFLSKCAKNVFLSEVKKETDYRARYHVTSDNLESIYGTTDHEMDKKDAYEDVKKAFENMFVRWGSPQEQAAIRYLLCCIVDEENHNKQAAIRAACYAFGIPADVAKVFYNWCLIDLRTQLYDKVSVPFTEQDLFRHLNSYDNLIDMLDIISWEQMKKLIVTMGGMRLRIPTIAQVAKQKSDYNIFREIEASDMDPGSIAEVARRHRKSPKTAQQIFRDLAVTTRADRAGEYELYPNTQGMPTP